MDRKTNMMMDMEHTLRKACTTAEEVHDADLTTDAVNYIVNAGLEVVDRNSHIESYFAIHTPSMEPLNIEQRHFPRLRDLVREIKNNGFHPSNVKIYCLCNGIVRQVSPDQYLVTPEPTWMDL